MDMEQDKLKQMDLKTLELVLAEFKSCEQYLRSNKPRNSCVAGIELAEQMICDVIKDKKKLEGEK